MDKIPVGTKWFRYVGDNDKPEVIRILDSNSNKNKIRYMDNDCKNHIIDSEKQCVP